MPISLSAYICVIGYIVSINQHINSLLSTLNNVQYYAFMGKFEFYTNFKVDNWVNIYKLYNKSQNIGRKKKKLIDIA